MQLNENTKQMYITRNKSNNLLIVNDYYDVLQNKKSMEKQIRDLFLETIIHQNKTIIGFLFLNLVNQIRVVDGEIILFTKIPQLGISKHLQQ